MTESVVEVALFIKWMWSPAKWSILPTKERKLVDVIPLFLQNVVVTDGSEKVPSSLSAEEIMSRSVLITETILFVRKERKKERARKKKNGVECVFFWLFKIRSESSSYNGLWNHCVSFNPYLKLNSV